MFNRADRDDDKPRVYCLCRVSHADSVKSGHSIPFQKSAARRYRRESLPGVKFGGESWPETEPPGFFVDRAVSAWKKGFAKRPASGRLLHVLQPGDYLLIYSVDRGFRNVADFGKTMSALNNAGIKVIFVSQPSVSNNTSAGKLIGNMLATVAQYSSDIKSERTKEALALRKLNLIPSTRKRRKTEPVDPGDFVVPECLVKKQEKAKGRVFLYVRCSHISSLESGLGLEKQRQEVERYAEKLRADGHEVLPVFQDNTVSAFRVPLSKRPEGKKIFDQIKPGDHFVVYRLDRGWRSIRDCTETIEKWTQQGVFVHLVSEGARSDDPLGKLYFYTMSYVAWVEAFFISVRTKEALAKFTVGGMCITPKRVGFKAVMRGGRKRVAVDVNEIGRKFYYASLRKQLGMSQSEFSDYIESVEASVQGRRIRPIEPTGRRKGRYWTPSKINHSEAKLAELMPIIEANGIKLPDAETLHKKGLLIRTL